MKQILDHTDSLIIVSYYFTAICYLGYLWVSNKFCKKYFEISKRNEVLFIIFSFGGWLLFNIANKHDPIPHIFLMIAEHIVFMGLVLLLFQADKEKKILAATMLITTLTLVGNFCDSFLSCLTLFFRHTIKKIPEPFLSEQESGLIVCISFGLVILTIYQISKHLSSVFYGKRGKWYVVSAIPLFAITAVIDVVNWGASNGIMVKSREIISLYYDQIFSHTEICVLTGLSIFAVGFYVFGMNWIYLEQEKNGQYHSQIAVYKMLEEQYRQSERLRHDMKNHILALSGLCQSKEWEKMENYLKNMENSSLEACGDITGNKAMDALLYQKRKRAEKEHIQWECDVWIPKICSIHEFDLCVLFGNILDNALEACERLPYSEYRYIYIQAKTVKKYFLIEVKNSMNRTEKQKKKQYGFTNKENPQEHGIGLLNIGDVVRKYNGAVNIEAQNGIFIISVLIPLKTALH